MLVLRMKVDGKVFIGDDIVIQVVRASSGQIHLGITAPKHIEILRGELKEPTPISVK